MDVKEFRIGNILQSDCGKLLSVNAISEKGLSFVTINEKSEPLKKGWKPEPIKLNEEWMNKLSFYKDECSRSYRKEFGDLFIEVFISEETVSVLCEKQITIVTKLHELQNIHYSLTGKEII